MANAWLHRLALTTAGTTLFLLFVGALVTSKGAGLAVPDWPTTFGHNMFLFPWARMVDGVFYEHSHRLVASGVGFLTLVLAVCLWLREPRAWVRGLGLAALALVIVQGIIGGLRVVWLEQDFAIIHAGLAQAFFAVMVSMALFTSRAWRDMRPDMPFRSFRQEGPGGSPTAGVEAPRPAPSGRWTPFPWFCLAAVLLIYIQSLLGAVIRHTGTGVVAHVLTALPVTVLAGALALKAFRVGEEAPVFRSLALFLGALLLLQLGLGTASYAARFLAAGAAWAPGVTVAVTTGHVVTGALMLAVTVVMTLWAFRQLGAGGFPALGGAVAGRVPA